MEGQTAVWLAITLAAPVTLVPQIALLRLFHSRKSAWHPLDILVVSLLVAQLCCTVLTFGISTTALIRHVGIWENVFQGNGTPFCALLICGWAAAHTLQAATLASFAVDRALTVRWPYKYRLSVRRTQIRYHVVVLSIISLLVGVAAFFAMADSSHKTSVPAPIDLKHQVSDSDFTGNRDRVTAVNSTSDSASAIPTPMALVASSKVDPSGCAFLPHMFDGRYSLFWLCLHGVLFLTTAAALMVVVVTAIMIKCCGSQRLGSGSDLRTLGNVSNGSSGTLPPVPPPPPRYTPTPVASFRHLQQQLSDANLSPLARSNQNLLASDKTYVHVIHQDHNRHLSPTDKSSQANHYSASMEPAWNKQRHSTVAAVLIIAYLTYHLPLLVLTAIGTYFDHLLPDWPFSSMALGTGLIHSLLLMVLLVLIDPHINRWMLDSLKPKSRCKRSPVISESPSLEQTISPFKIDEESRYHLSQLYSHEAAEVKFPLTNGSLFAHLMNPPSSADGARVRDRRTSRMGISAYDNRLRAMGSFPNPTYLETKAPLMTFMSRSKILASNGLKPQVEPLYSDPLPSTEVVAASAVCPTSSKFRRPEPIYATLSETMSSSNTLQSTSPSRSNGRRLHDADSDDEGSATESAGDDFEFHNARSSRQTLIVHDAVLEHSRQAPVDSSNRPLESQSDADSKQRLRVTRSATYRILCNGLDVKCAKRQDPQSTLTASSESQHGIVTCVTFQVEEDQPAESPFTAASLRRSKLLTSLSMNDIDMVGQEDQSPHQDKIDVPVRSDSLFSLYKIDVPLSVEIESDGKEQNQQVPKISDDYQVENTDHPVKPQFDTQFLVHASIDSSKVADQNQDGSKLRDRVERTPSQRREDPQQGFLHYRKKSMNRSRTAVLQRFQERNSSNGNRSLQPSKTNSVVSIAALKAALSQPSMSYLDNGDIYPTSLHQEKTVFVSEYI